MKCAGCGKEFSRGYKISAKRAARPQYCSKECGADAVRKLAASRREAAFWKKVNSWAGVSACWPWRGYRDPNGYGRWGRVLAHRVAYELFYQRGYRSLKPEQVVRHSCDSPSCCNPFHLELGTQLDNIADMDLRKRRRLPKPRRGEDSNKAKLTAADALYIFESGKTHRELANQFGISSVAVGHIKRGKNWAHVTGGRNAR